MHLSLQITRAGRWALQLLLIGSFFLLTSSMLPVQDELATIRIYQKSSFASPRFALEINEQLRIKPLKARSWLEFQIPAGTHKIATVSPNQFFGYDSKSYTMKVEAGKIYYFEAVIDYNFFSLNMLLMEREAEEAEIYIKRFKKDEKAIPQMDTSY
ncbi:MAG: hypothetical protein AAFU33_27840 [Bacteroidota bacterium]